MNESKSKLEEFVTNYEEMQKKKRKKKLRIARLEKDEEEIKFEEDKKQLQDVIEDQTRQALAPLTSDVKINWVWMPPWGPDKISDDGRDQLRALGFTV